MLGRFGDKFRDSDIITTFYDVILLPGKSLVEPREVDLRTKVSRSYAINIPFVSSPMDTVTGAELAIALARQGGIGILHRNCTVETQISMAIKVKRAESTIIRDVIVINSESSVGKAIQIMKEHNIHGLPIVDDDRRLIGIVTWRDVRYSDPKLLVRDVMTPRDRLVVADEKISIEEAKILMQKHRIEKLPIVDSNWRLKGLMTIKDLELRGKYPRASRDDEGRLLVGAAVSPYDENRALKLDKYVDILVIDVAHFHNDNVIKATKKLARNISSELIIGNLGTREGVLEAISSIEKVDGLRVGIGSGSICTTGIITRVAAPTLYATIQAADALDEIGELGNIPIIADGGIKNSGDIALSLAAGASAVMMGNIFAGTRESPGRLVAIEGKYYKEYYGMGSARARSKMMRLDRYAKLSKDIEEGVEGWVPYKGTVEDVVKEMVAGLQAAMGYAGARNISDMWFKTRFARLTPHGIEEIKPHNIYMLH